MVGVGCNCTSPTNQPVTFATSEGSFAAAHAKLGVVEVRFEREMREDIIARDNSVTNEIKSAMKVSM